MNTKVMNYTLKIHVFNSLWVKALRTLFRGSHLPLPQVLNMKSLTAFPDDAPLGVMKLSMLMITSFFFLYALFDFTPLFEVRAMAHYFSFNVFQLKYSYTISPLSFPLSNPSHDSPVLLSLPRRHLNTLNSLLSFLLTSPGCVPWLRLSPVRT